MKKWFCFLLALALLIPGAAMAENFGLKPQRPSADSKVELPEPAAATDESALADIDLSSYSDEALSALANRIYDELSSRQSPTYNLSIEDGLMLIDQDGVRLSLFEMNYSDDYDPILRCEVMVENNTGKTISLSILDPEIDGVAVSGIGIYEVPDGQTLSDFFFFELLEETDDPEILENGNVLTFTFEVWDDETYETIFEVPVTLQ